MNLIQNTIIRSIERWAWWDKEYLALLIRYAFPIALQNLIWSLLNMVGVIMIGQLGETSIAAVGLANQIYFLQVLLLFGINSGAAIFTAQYWGKKDVSNIRRVLGIMLIISLLSSLAFMTISILKPEFALGLYSKDPEVVSLGSQYLQIYGWVFLFIAISFAYATVLRTVGDVKTPLVVNMISLLIGTMISYLTIFGFFFIPAMGVKGAALGALIGRIFECILLLGITYLKKSPVAGRIKELLAFDFSFVKKVLSQVIPVAANELFWALGITLYNLIYARIGTTAYAAMNISMTIDSVAMVLFIGIGNATAIMTGNLIGAGSEKQANRYAGKSIYLGIGLAFLVGIVIFTSFILYINLFNVSQEVIEYAHDILTVISMFLWIRVTNLIIYIGILRAGGDTRYALFVDVGTVWLIGIPLAAIGAFIWHLPIQWVYLLVMGDEIAKCAIGLLRYRSKKWIHNLIISI